MALPQLIANSPTPGVRTPLTTLGAIVSTTPAANTSETWTFASGPPAALATAGQFTFVVDNEILLDVTGGSGTSRTVLRGQEGSTPATHANGSQVWHYLTAGAATALASPLQPVAKSADYTAVPGDLVLMTGAHTVTLPALPAGGTRVGVMALSGNVSVNRNTTPGTETIFNQGTGSLTTLLLFAGANATLMYLSGVWYVIAGGSTRQPQCQTGQATLAHAGGGLGDFQINLPTAWPVSHDCFLASAMPLTNVTSVFLVRVGVNSLSQGDIGVNASSAQNFAITWASFGH
jgi:hypothetical protein